MKAKLIKKEHSYDLFTQGFLKGSTNHPLIGKLNVEEGNVRYKLSKQNCDEIFGVVDVDKLAEQFTVDESYGEISGDLFKGYIYGFNKAMELNKDKVFTLGQLITAMDMARVMIDGKYANSGEYIYNFIQQPTEIEVTFNPEEKDSEGCLILKKI